MTTRKLTVLGAFVMLAAILLDQPVQADAIDGNWCFKGRFLSIDGPKMLTPGGKTINGEYDRHGFIYKAPSGEKEAGAMVFIASIDDETMEFRVGSDKEKPQIWHRCAAPTS
jgi:hypothetical protein